MIRACLLAPLALAGLLETADARDLVGTGFVNNKIVQLFDDGTWEYFTDPPPEGCKILADNLQFCDTDRKWRRLSQASFDFDAIFTHGREIYAGTIAEAVGSVNGVSEESMISVALSGAAEVSQVAVEEIPVHSVEPDTIDGHSGQRIIYGASDLGVKFVYANSIIVKHGFALQAITWAVGSEFSEEHQTMHDNFVSKLRITYEDPTQ